MDSWLDLLNSDWHDHLGSGRREDRLDNPEWLERYLSGLGYHGVAGRKAEVRNALGELRAIVRAIVDHIVADEAISTVLWDRINEYLAGSPFVRRMESSKSGYALRPVPLKNDVTALTGRIAADFCQTLAEGEPKRIKICDNKDCLWFFYDNSKNRSRRWCEGNTGCGNLMKVRRFRARERRTKAGRKKRTVS